MGELDLMFDDLVRSEEREVRGKTFVFSEIGALAWVEHVMTEDAPSEGLKGRAEANHDYMCRVVACSIERGLDKSIDDVYRELLSKPGALVSEMYAHADAVNGLSEKFVMLEGKDAPASDTPES